MTDSQTTQQSTTQDISLIEGSFLPSDAADIINVMLDKKISFHTLQSLRRLEGNHDDPCTHDTTRLAQLKSEKIRLNEIIKDARSNNKKLRVKSFINIELID